MSLIQPKRAIRLVKKRPHSHDVSTVSNTTVISIQKMNSTNQEFELSEFA